MQNKSCENKVILVTGATNGIGEATAMAFAREGAKRTREQSLANYRSVMDINVLGGLLAMKHEISAMLKSGGGSIANNASVGGRESKPWQR